MGLFKFIGNVYALHKMCQETKEKEWRKQYWEEREAQQAYWKKFEEAKERDKKREKEIIDREIENERLWRQKANQKAEKEKMENEYIEQEAIWQDACKKEYEFNANLEAMTPDKPLSETKKLFRKLVMHAHPDRGGDNDKIRAVYDKYDEIKKLKNTK